MHIPCVVILMAPVVVYVLLVQHYKKLFLDKIFGLQKVTPTMPQSPYIKGSSSHAGTRVRKRKTKKQK